MDLKIIRVTLYLHIYRHAHKYMDKSTYKPIKHTDKHTVIHGYLNICGGIPVAKISLLTLAVFFSPRCLACLGIEVAQGNCNHTVTSVEDGICYCHY